MQNTKIDNTPKEKTRQRSFLSPKLIRRKTQNRGRLIQKPIDEYSQLFCYISPNRNVQKAIKNSESVTSFIGICGSPRSKINQKQQEGANNYRHVRQKSIGNFTEIQPNAKLTQKIKELQKKLIECQGKIERTTQQNTYCLQKMQQLTKSLIQKDKKIKTLQKLKDKNNKKIEVLIENKMIKENEIMYLQDTISNLNKSLQQKNLIGNFCEDTDDGEKSTLTNNNYAIQLENQIQDYKKMITSYSEKIKYYEIHQHLYKKLLCDFQQQQNRNERLKIINRKMVRKIQALQFIKNKQNLKQQQEQDSISFDFSPCK